MKWTRGELDTPMGDLCAITHHDTLIALSWLDRMDATAEHLKRHRPAARLEVGPVPETVDWALTQYFSGEPAALDSLRIDPPGTDFQRAVWRALRTIPFGTVISYADLARLMRRPRATRAVANANGRNPIPIVIPCHRVIASDGSLGGFSSGVERKEILLSHERTFTG